MYNRLVKKISYMGYDITMRKSDINGYYQLSTMMGNGVNEYRVARVYDYEPQEEDVRAFIKYEKAMA